ncbi:MAG: Coenzyme F420 hydrogenase/dehydrogenase, beta subunit C-terminal domain [Pikeienuella sp.]
MRPFSSLNDIVENGYCLSCGLCTQVVEDGALTMALNKGGNVRPRASRELTSAENARIVSICPGVTMNGPFADELTAPDPVWGDIRVTYEGWATDDDTRWRASAGGVMTALNQYLLESGRVAFILQNRAATGDALMSEPVLIRDPAELLTGSQSRYAPSAPLTAINEALALNEPFAVSLKPCDIAGVRNLQRQDRRAAELIKFTQAMFCGTVPSRETTTKMLARKGYSDAPDTFRWRGDGCPGAARATWKDGRKATATYQEMWTEARWTTQFRCKICPDAIGLHADIATGDFWPGGVPTQETPGENGIIAHTDIGEEILNAAAAAGYLKLKPTDLATIAGTQPHHVRLRQTFSARVAGAAVAGAPFPEFAGMATGRCAGQATADDLAAVFAGTMERVRAGQADEISEFDDWEPT